MKATLDKPTIPLKTFLNERMNPYQIGIPLVLSLIISFITGTIILLQFSDSNKLSVESIAPHVAALLETQDRPEMQRFIRSVSEKQKTSMEVIYNGEVIASTLDPSRIGKKFDARVTSVPLLGLHLVDGRPISFADVKRVNGRNNYNAKIGIYLNTKSLIYVSAGISISIFIFLIFFTSWLVAKVIKESQSGFSHLEELEKAIREIQDNFDSAEIPSFRILEFENIRKAFFDTKGALKASNERIAHAKAKEMASYAYKNLIHDLHVPVTALRNHLKIMGHERATEADKAKALERIVDLAEQVLRQVKSARSHLGLEVTLNDSDVIESIKKAANNAQVASFDRPNVEIKSQFPEKEIIKAHDPILLGRAISNLVSNAIEAALSKVEINVTEEDQDLRIRISDDGKGMSQEDVSLHLQGRGKSTKSERMGIGLASANHIIRSHGGKIIYQKSSYGGACFEVRLQGGTI